MVSPEAWEYEMVETSDKDVPWQNKVRSGVNRGNRKHGGRWGVLRVKRGVDFRGRLTEITPYDSITEISIFLAPV